MKNITTFDLNELNKFDKIFCLVSGGIDSTYLLELLSENFGKKVFPVNCFNPYENSDTLDRIKKLENFILIKPIKSIDYKEILIKAFLNLPKSYKKPYQKKNFGCCNAIKHKAFFDNPIFKEKNTVVISGIKFADGMQRKLWLKSLVDGKTTSKGTIIINAPTFFHKHKGGQLYCYPFRDFKQRNFPKEIIDELKLKYPLLSHSGCAICPVLVRFENRKNIINEDFVRLQNSIEFAKNLNVYHVYDS